MGLRQVHPVTKPKSVETFRVCRAFFADHFGNKFVRIWPCFCQDIGQILFMLFFAHEDFYANNRGSNLWKTKDNSSLTARMLEPNTDSESSWKTIHTFFCDFSWHTCSLGQHVNEKKYWNINKKRRILRNGGNASWIEQNLLYKTH
jgi:hypothetical protein